MKVFDDPMVNDYSVFAWDAGTRSFVADVSSTTGFTGERYDGEAKGFAIRGKSGEVMWFHIVEDIMDDDDHVGAFRLAPSCSRGRALDLTGLIANV